MPKSLEGYDTQELLAELKRRNFNITDPTLVDTELLIKELRDRFDTVMICFYPPPALKAKYKCRYLFNGEHEKLVTMMQSAIHDILLDGGFIGHDSHTEDPDGRH